MSIFNPGLTSNNHRTAYVIPARRRENVASTSAPARAVPGRLAQASATLHPLQAPQVAGVSARSGKPVAAVRAPAKEQTEIVPEPASPQAAEAKSQSEIVPAPASPHAARAETVTPASAPAMSEFILPSNPVGTGVNYAARARLQRTDRKDQFKIHFGEPGSPEHKVYTVTVNAREIDPSRETLQDLCRDVGSLIVLARRQNPNFARASFSCKDPASDKPITSASLLAPGPQGGEVVETWSLDSKIPKSEPNNDRATDCLEVTYEAEITRIMARLTRHISLPVSAGFEIKDDAQVASK